MTFRYLGEPWWSRFLGHFLGTPQQAGGLTPILDNLTLDLDSRFDTYQTVGGVASGNGDPVGSWLDQSGNNHDVSQAAAALRPLKYTGQVNGKPALTFDGNDDRFSTGPAFNTIFTNAAKSIYVVCNPTSFNTDAATLYQNELVTGQSAAYWAFPYFRSTGPVAGHYNHDGAPDGVTTSTATGWQIVHGRHNGTNIYISMNGAAEASAASGNTTNMTGSFVVGYLIGTGYFTGQVARILCYNAVHDAAQKAQNLAYLSALYGIAV